MHNKIISFTINLDVSMKFLRIVGEFSLRNGSNFSKMQTEQYLGLFPQCKKTEGYLSSYVLNSALFCFLFFVLKNLFPAKRSKWWLALHK